MNFLSQEDKNFFVEDGFIQDGLPRGKIVTHKKTGNWIWTNPAITVNDAKIKLLIEHERACKGCLE